MQAINRSALLGIGLLASFASLPASATVGFEVVFNDPQGMYSSYYADLERMTVAAGKDWINHFQGATANTTLTVSIGFAGVPTANGGSATTSFFGTSGGLNVFEQGAAAKVKSGVDANGSAADILINVGINGYLQQELWFDPDPFARIASVPVNQTDAMSVMLHEFGHAFGFNGWRNGTTGTLPGNYESTFDVYTYVATTSAGTSMFFNGPSAVAVYGAPVPITLGNYGHVANAMPGLGADLIGDLMNGVVYYRGSRYGISALDLAIMQDVGLPVLAVPEPSTLALCIAGLAGLVSRVSRGNRAA